MKLNVSSSVFHTCPSVLVCGNSLLSKSIVGFNSAVGIAFNSSFEFDIHFLGSIPADFHSSVSSLYNLLPVLTSSTLFMVSSIYVLFNMASDANGNSFSYFLAWLLATNCDKKGAAFNPKNNLLNSYMSGSFSIDSLHRNLKNDWSLSSSSIW